MEAIFLVTRPGAVAIFTDCLIAAIRTLMFIGPVVPGMATSTVRLERRILPRNGLGVRLVTLGTLQVAAMIQWLIGQRRMTELVRCKRVGVVALVAFLLRYEVTVIAPYCRYTVVA